MSFWDRSQSKSSNPNESLLSTRSNKNIVTKKYHKKSSSTIPTKTKSHKRAWSGTTRRNTVIGIDHGIGSGRAPLSKLNSLTMSSMHRKDEDRNKRETKESSVSDEMAIANLRNVLSVPQNVSQYPTSNYTPQTTEFSNFNSCQDQSSKFPTSPTSRPPLSSPAVPSPPTVAPPPSAKKKDYSSNPGFLDLSQFEYQSHHYQPKKRQLPVSEPSMNAISPSMTTGESAISPNSRKPPPPPGPPPATAKRKMAQFSTVTSKGTPSPPTTTRFETEGYQQKMRMNDELEAMQERITNLTSEFKRREEEQSVAIAALMKQNKQLERANTHLRRERDRYLLQHQQEKRTNPSGVKNPVQRGLEIQLQQARSQLNKERKKNNDSMETLKNNQNKLIAKIEILKKDALTGTEEIYNMKKLLKQAEIRDGKLNRERDQLYHQVLSLQKNLKEARSQLRASAAISFQQFDGASQTTSPNLNNNQLDEPINVPEMISGTMGERSSSEQRGIKTPHPKRAPPPRPPS
jgi:hypothetical protein